MGICLTADNTTVQIHPGAGNGDQLALNWAERQLIPSSLEANAKAFFASFTSLSMSQINEVYDQVIRNISTNDALQFSSINTSNSVIVLTPAQMGIVQQQINQLMSNLQGLVQQQFTNAVSKGKLACPKCSG